MPALSCQQDCSLAFGIGRHQRQVRQQRFTEALRRRDPRATDDNQVQMGQERLAIVPRRSDEHWTAGRKRIAPDAPMEPKVFHRGLTCVKIARDV